MTKHLGELDDDDLVMFVVEHLKDHKGPQKLVEGLEPVRSPVTRWPIHALTRQLLGSGGRGYGVRDRSLATSDFREHGLRGGIAHREDDGRVREMSPYLLTGMFCTHQIPTPFFYST